MVPVPFLCQASAERVELRAIRSVRLRRSRHLRRPLRSPTHRRRPTVFPVEWTRCHRLSAVAFPQRRRPSPRGRTLDRRVPSDRHAPSSRSRTSTSKPRSRSKPPSASRSSPTEVDASCAGLSSQSTLGDPISGKPSPAISLRCTRTENPGLAIRAWRFPPWDSRLATVLSTFSAVARGIGGLGSGTLRRLWRFGRICGKRRFFGLVGMFGLLWGLRLPDCRLRLSSDVGTKSASNTSPQTRWWPNHG